MPSWSSTTAMMMSISAFNADRIVTWQEITLPGSLLKKIQYV